MLHSTCTRGLNNSGGGLVIKVLHHTQIL